MTMSWTRAIITHAWRLIKDLPSVVLEYFSGISQVSVAKHGPFIRLFVCYLLSHQYRWLRGEKSDYFTVTVSAIFIHPCHPPTCSPHSITQYSVLCKGEDHLLVVKKTMSLGNKRVLISDPIDPCCPTKLTEAGFTVDLKPGISKEDLTACIKVNIHIKY